MPTERPRLTITLTPDIDRALTDFSRLTGESKSAFIVQVLAEAVPHLERMAVVIQQAKQLHGEAYQAAQSSLSKYADAVMHQASGLLKSSDLFLDQAAMASVRSASEKKLAEPAITELQRHLVETKKGLLFRTIQAEVAAADSKRAAASPLPAAAAAGRAKGARPPSVNKGVGDSQKGRGKGSSKVVQLRTKA